MTCTSLDLPSLITWSLEHGLQDQSVFYAERLLVQLEEEAASQETSWVQKEPLIWTACRAYFAANDFEAVCFYLNQFMSGKTCLSPRCAFLLAQASWKLQRFEQAERLLLEYCLYPWTASAPVEISIPQSWKLAQLSNPFYKLSVDSPVEFQRFAVDASVVWTWLGRICQTTHRQKQALAYYQAALKLNPFLMEAMEGFLKLGGQVSMEKLLAEDVCRLWVQQNCAVNAAPVKEKTADAQNDSQAVSHTNDGMMVDGNQKNTGENASVRRNQDDGDGGNVMQPIPIPQPQPKSSRITRTVSTRRTLASATTSVAGNSSTGQTMNTIKKRTRSGDTKSSEKHGPLQSVSHNDVAMEVLIPVREKNRSISNISSAVKNATASLNTMQVSENRTSCKPSGLQFSVYRRCCSILQLLHQYRLKECIQLISRHDQVLSHFHYDSAWIQAILARSYFEDLNYEMAAKTFKRLRQLQPFRSKDMDVYSTVLWHLKDQVELSYLAQQLASFAAHAVETWCVFGNCWSLNKEHENATRCFQRAQILAGIGFHDENGLSIPQNADMPAIASANRFILSGVGAYACNLSGSEYMANEAFEKALVSYRTAIRLDSRLYNAWFGLGVIYYKQEKWELAEFHFRKALSIHRSNTILQCYVGMVLHKTKKYEEALLYFDRAIQLNPKNPQVHYRKALCLMDLQRLEESIKEFQQVIILAPKETRVYFTMGKVYHQLGRTGEALKMYLQAMEVDVKMSSHVREAIDSLHLSDGDAVQEIYRAFG